MGTFKACDYAASCALPYRKLTESHACRAIKHSFHPEEFRRFTPSSSNSQFRRITLHERKIANALIENG